MTLFITFFLLFPCCLDRLLFFFDTPHGLADCCEPIACMFTYLPLWLCLKVDYSIQQLLLLPLPLHLDLMTIYPVFYVLRRSIPLVIESISFSNDVESLA